MSAPADDRPNILLVMVDQLADQWFDLARTPALDQLCNEGVRFDAAYSNSPLCAPARFAMMSGRLNSVIGAYDCEITVGVIGLGLTLHTTGR